MASPYGLTAAEAAEILDITPQSSRDSPCSGPQTPAAAPVLGPQSAKVADILAISTTRVRQLVERGRIPAVRHRGKWFFRRHQIEV